jgi:negative regulator of flagellin synthesis FlgM
MKINQAIDSLQAGTSPATGPKNEKAEPASQKPRPAPAADAVPRTTVPITGGESLNISQLSTKMQNLESRLAGGEEFDTARVSEIKQAVRDGSFKVDAGAVADKLISSAHDLFIKRH